MPMTLPTVVNAVLYAILTAAFTVVVICSAIAALSSRPGRTDHRTRARAGRGGADADR